MNLQQKAIIDQATKEGVLPCERDARLVVYSMVDATRKAMTKYEVGLNKMTQIQQDAVFADLEEAYKEIALIIARTLASGSTPSVPFTLKDMKIANGTVTGLVNGAEKHFNELISKVQDKSEVLIVLYPRDYADAMDGIQGEKDQRDLPLANDAPADKPAKAATPRVSSSTGSATSAAALAKKAVELPAKYIEDGRKFITEQQNCKASALQNHLKKGAVFVDALLKHFDEVEGLIEFVGTEQSGEYQLKRALAEGDKPAKAAKAAKAKPSPKEQIEDVPGSIKGALSFDGEDETGDVQPVAQVLTDEIYEAVKAQVIKTKKVSIGALSITQNIDDEIAEQAVQRLEMEGVVSEENEMGLREVLVTA